MPGAVASMSPSRARLRARRGRGPLVRSGDEPEVEHARPPAIVHDHVVRLEVARAGFEYFEGVPEITVPDQLRIRELLTALADAFGMPAATARNPMVRRVGWITQERAEDRAYWARHDAPEVRFYRRSASGRSTKSGVWRQAPSYVWPARERSALASTLHAGRGHARIKCRTPRSRCRSTAQPRG